MMHRHDIFKIDCIGRWRSSQVHIDFSNHEYVLPGSLPTQARIFWDDLIKRRPRFFNGALCRLDRYAAGADAIQLDLSRTCYRDLLFCNAHVQDILNDFGETALVRALGISIIIETADGLLPLMQRSDTLGEGAGLIDVFGGHVHPDEHARNGAPDVFHAIADEVYTELNLKPEDCGEIFCVGLLENRLTRKPELIFETKISMTGDALREKSRHARERDEYTEILLVPADARAVQNMLRQQGSQLTPVGYGSLALLGELHKWW